MTELQLLPFLGLIWAGLVGQLNEIPWLPPVEFPMAAPQLALGFVRARVTEVAEQVGLMRRQPTQIANVRTIWKRRKLVQLRTSRIAPSL